MKALRVVLLAVVTVGLLGATAYGAGYVVRDDTGHRATTGRPGHRRGRRPTPEPEPTPPDPDAHAGRRSPSSGSSRATAGCRCASCSRGSSSSPGSRS